MKQVSGNLWFTTEKDQTNIGFTRSFISERLAECFHVVLADTKNVKEKGPLLVLETNDGLEPVCSPATGRIIYFNEKARNFPDRLTEEDCIVSLSNKELAKVAKTMFVDNYVVQGQQAVQGAGGFNFADPQNWVPQQAPAIRNDPVLQPEPLVPVRREGESDERWQQRVSTFVRVRNGIRAANQQVIAAQVQANAPVAQPRRRPPPRPIAWDGIEVNEEV